MQRAADAALAAAGRSGEEQLVTFALAGEEFGVPIAVVKEIVRVPDITRIPRTPAFVEGVANLRGSILPVVNLRTRFGLPDEERTDDNRVVVIEVGGRLTGLVVDQVSEVMSIAGDAIEPVPPVVAATLDIQYLRGVAKLEDGERLVILLEIEQVMPAAEIGATLAAAAQHGAGAAGAAGQTARQLVDEEQVVSFRIGAEEYGIAIADVQEIIRVPEISHLPMAPAFIEGVVALRNRLLPIVNLRKRFAMPVVEVDDDSRIVVVNAGGVVTGVQVDAVQEVLSVPVDAIEPTPGIITSGRVHQLRGVAKLQEGRRLIMLLDVGQVLSASELSELSELAGEDGAAVAEHDARRRAIVSEEQFVSFRIEDEEFGVSIQQVQEIIWLPEITRVPRSPHFVEGVINLRGNVLPVIDMRKRFGMPPTEATESTSIVVVDVEGHKTGVIVDAVSEVMRLANDAIEPPPPVVAGIDASFVKGVGKLADGQHMLIILDLAQVIGAEAA